MVTFVFITLKKEIKIKVHMKYYSFKHYPNEFNESKVIIGKGLPSKEKESLNSLYYDPKTEYSVSAINDLVRKSKLSLNKVKKFLDTLDTYTLHKLIRKSLNEEFMLVELINNCKQI